VLHITRDGVLFAVGIMGIIYETVRQQAERPFLLATFAAMTGLPVFLRTDEKKAQPERANPYMKPRDAPLELGDEES
jgi:hypothetical protein